MDKPWLAHYPPGVPPTIDPDRYGTIVDVFAASAQAHPQRRAFVSGATGKALTYRDVDRGSRWFAGYLHGVLGLASGARVALMMPNVLQYPLCVLGALRAGCIVVNVNPLYTPRELAHQLKDSGAEVIVALEQLAPVVAAAREGTAVAHVVITGAADMLRFGGAGGTSAPPLPEQAATLPLLPGAVRLRQALARGARADAAPVATAPSDVAFLQYTGGTTGVSKGAVLTHRNIVANLKQSRAWGAPHLDLTRENVMITAIPLYHIYALTNCLMLGIDLGVVNVLVADPRNTPAFVRVLAQYRFAILPAVNTLFNALINDPDFAKVDFSELRTTAGGGAAIQRSVARRWREITGVPIREGYGLTECAPTVTANPYNVRDFDGSVGMPLPSTEISIRNDAGNEVREGEPGELCVRGPQVMQGYWNRPEETARVMMADGFLRTGDIARVDARGYVFLVDRKKDLILVSGFNVYPNEIEDVVALHPGVFEAAAVGVPDAKSGEAVTIFVVKKDPALTADALLAHCRQNLTAYKIPRHVVFLDALPKSNVGKILRRELREEALARR
jgi:long-chain acyl-CoA synthetase